MLVLVIVALVATTAFYRQARIVNVSPGKAASVPFVAAGLFLIASYCTSLGLGSFTAWSGISPAIARSIAYMANAFYILAYLALIRRNWQALNAHG